MRAAQSRRTNLRLGRFLSQGIIFMRPQPLDFHGKERNAHYHGGQFVAPAQHPLHSSLCFFNFHWVLQFSQTSVSNLFIVLILDSNLLKKHRFSVQVRLISVTQRHGVTNMYYLNTVSIVYKVKFLQSFSGSLKFPLSNTVSYPAILTLGYLLVI